MHPCENCEQRPATVQLIRALNGHEEALHLCAHCASHAQAAMGSPFNLENLIESLFGSKPRSRENLLNRLSEEAQAAHLDHLRSTYNRYDRERRRSAD